LLPTFLAGNLAASTRRYHRTFDKEADVCGKWRGTRLFVPRYDSMLQNVVIRRFRDVDVEAFRQLNTAWINQYFEMEEKDRRMLARPASIVEAGGVILMAESEGQAIGCVALLRLSLEDVELAKMTVAETWRRHGVGRALLDAAIDAARAMAARRIYLESNSKLTAAIALYERVGFHHLVGDDRPPPAYQTADVFMQLEL
jgi:predicted N-acetyltransferase YhbS